MKAQLVTFLLLLPTFAWGSNQDNLIIKDLDAAIAGFETVIQEAHDGAPDLLPRTAYRIGVATAHLDLATIRAKAVFTRDGGETKLVDQVGWISELIGKQVMVFGGQDPVLSSDPKPGTFNDDFFKMVGGYLAFARHYKDEVVKRAGTSPKMEYFVRDTKVVADRIGLGAYQIDLIVQTRKEHPDRPWGLCLFFGSLDAFLPFIVADADYLKAVDARGGEIADAAHALANGPRYGAAFCGLPGAAAGGIVAGQPNAALSQLVEEQARQFQALKEKAAQLRGPAEK